MNDAIEFSLSQETLMVSDPPFYKWRPRPDITAYELSLCLPILIVNWTKGVEELPDEAKRHFAKVD